MISNNVKSRKDSGENSFSVIYEYNNKNQRIRMTIYNVYDDKDEQHRIDLKYNDKGLLVEAIHYDKNNQLKELSVYEYE